MKMIRFPNSIKNFIPVFAGFLIVGFLLWNHLIRERLPKSLPLKLVDYQIFFLAITCISFLIALILVIKLILKLDIKPNILLANVGTYYIKSLQQFEVFIKRKIPLWNIIEKLIFDLLFYLRDSSYSKLIYLGFHLPKVIVSLTLLFDIYYQNKISVFYISLTLLLIPLIYRYIDHNLHVYYILELEKIESVLDIHIQEGEGESLREYKITTEALHYFIQETTLERLKKKESIPTFRVRLSEDFMLKHPHANFQEVFDFFYYDVLSLCSDHYEVLNRFCIIKKSLDPFINLCSIIIFTFCWIYLFFTSSMTLTDNFINFWFTLFCNL